MVTTMMDGVGVSPGTVALGVTYEVMICVEGGIEEAVTTTVEDGGAGFEEGAAEEAGGGDEDGGMDTGVELGWSDEGGAAEEEGSVTDGEGVGVGVGVADGSDDGATEGEGTVEDSDGGGLDGDGSGTEEEAMKDDVLAVELLAMATMGRRRRQAQKNRRRRHDWEALSVRDVCDAQSRNVCQKDVRCGGGWGRRPDQTAANDGAWGLWSAVRCGLRNTAGTLLSGWDGVRLRRRGGEVETRVSTC